jgi:hypothetical protein
MSGDTTTYALTGQVAATLRQYPITAAQGSYAVTGQAATLTSFASSVTALVWGTFPSSGTVSVASTPFSIGANGTVGANIVVTMSDNGGGGAFKTEGGTTITTVTLTTGSPSATFTYTPASTGAKTISVTNVLGLTPPGNITYTSNAGATLVLSGPSSGLTNSSSAVVFTVGSSGSITTPVNVYLSDGGATPTNLSTTRFFPLFYEGDDLRVVFVTRVQLTAANPTKSFWYIPTSSGAKSLTLTNDGGLGNPPAHTYTVTDAVGSATPFRLTRGGATVGSYRSLQRCQDIGAWQSGDVVKVASGTYTPTAEAQPGFTPVAQYPDGNSGAWGVRVQDMTIEAEDPINPPLIDMSRWSVVSIWSGGEPQFLNMGSECRTLAVRNMHFRGGRAAVGMAGKQGQIINTASYSTGSPAATLTVEYCKFSNHADAIHTQANHWGLSTYVRYCVFEDNGDIQGLRHDIYFGHNALAYVEGCTFRRTSSNPYPHDGLGHMVKSRSRATTVKACLFDGYLNANGTSGANSLFSIPNGGVTQIVGNVINHYGYYTDDTRSEPVRYGNDQYEGLTFATYPDMNKDPSLTTHSLLFAQNTVRQYSVSGAVAVSYPILFYVQSPGVSGLSPSTLWNGVGVSTAATAVVQNNLFYSDFTSKLATFLAAWPNNTIVAAGTLSDVGTYSGGVVAGNPATNNADKEWVGDHTITASRSDTNRGGRIVFIPTWVPSTAWQWTNIPNTNWGSQMPAVESGDTYAKDGYQAQFAYSGPCYSRKNHEMWVNGGGHAGTTLNAVSRYNLGTNSPNVTVICASTTKAIRNTEVDASDYFNDVYFSDGKAMASHTYQNLHYSDYYDELFIVGFGFMGSGGAGLGAAWSTADVAGMTRAGTWRASKWYADIPVSATASSHYIKKMISYDGTKIYWWRSPVGYGGDPSDYLYVFDIATKAHTQVGASVQPWYARAADNGSGTALVMGGADSSSGWQAKFCTLSTGSLATITMSGDSLPSGLEIRDVVWCANKGYWIAFWSNNPETMSTIRIATITQTSGSTATASVKTLTTGDGNPACATGIPATRFMSYDPIYSCLIFAMTPSSNIKTMKVA